ncbi:hypothetical protein CATRI_03370 [Corynebacterium atrinae]|uniref:DUF6928 family protein n=1 Tax=Corynebacterium atrinae TaxID=1336740 RepID=UPI0025B37FA7|nr:hypothetical protein [Corynebacterium atrinae]WJY62773.1 hypothetical protein CATRI_03370 [Corynebacterium atrinae]
MESVVTLWFVTAAEPATVIEAEPKADRGYGRKYLAQLNPAWPIVPIGQFPLNRSAPASTGEFYVAGFPGLTIVQTVIQDVPQLSEISSRLLDSVPAAEVYAFASGARGYGGFAHWRGGVLKRSLCATRTRTYEDVGLPEPFESPFWAGERAESIGGISLPFEPSDLVEEAQRQWIGVDVSPEGPDIQVVAYAVDGRPEPKFNDAPQGRVRQAPELGPVDGDYDDYEEHKEESDAFVRFADSSAEAVQSFRGSLTRRWRNARAYLSDKLRHTDRG